MGGFPAVGRHPHPGPSPIQGEGRKRRQSKRPAFVIVVGMQSDESRGGGDGRMALTFHVLASGSGGNASLLEVEGHGVLLDFGLRPRTLAQRLRACGGSWGHVQAAVLTHTHSDHWQAHTLAELLKRGVPLYCHAGHVNVLERAGTTFVAAGLQAGCFTFTRRASRGICPAAAAARRTRYRTMAASHAAFASMGRRTSSAPAGPWDTSRTWAAGTRRWRHGCAMWMCWLWNLTMTSNCSAAAAGRTT